VSFTWKAQSQAHKQRRRINLSTGHKDTRETRVPGPKSHKVYIISYYKYDKSDPAVPYAATKPPPHPLPQPPFKKPSAILVSHSLQAVRISGPEFIAPAVQRELATVSATSGAARKSIYN